MIRSLAIVVIGCAVGGIIIAQDAVPWPVTPKKLIHGRAPLSLNGEWEGRLVRLEGTILSRQIGADNLDGCTGHFLAVWGGGYVQIGTDLVLVFSDAPLRGSTEPTLVRFTGRVTRAPEEAVARFKGLDFPGRICVDATAPRVTWRSFVGFAVILWGFYIMVRGIKRERAKKSEEAAPAAQEPGE